MNRAIITGATSMIGIALTKELLSRGIEVTAIIRQKSHKKELLPENKLITVTECELEKLSSFVPADKADALFHLAWSGTSHTERDYPSVQQKNIAYTLDAVNLAERAGCSVFLGAGSQAEYGRTSDKLSDKTAVNPDSAYGIAKYAAGKLSRLLCFKLGIKHIWTRILSVYGPHDSSQTMISSSLNSLLHDRPKDYTPCEQVWDYLYVEDAAKALYLAAENGQDGAIYPIGSGEGKPLKEFLDIIGEVTCKKELIKIGTLDYSKNQVMFLCANIENLKRECGFVPEVSFKQGIERTVEWIKKQSV